MTGHFCTMLCRSRCTRHRRRRRSLRWQTKCTRSGWKMVSSIDSLSRSLSCSNSDMWGGRTRRQNQERTPQEGSSEITSKRSALLPAVSDRTTASHHASSPLGLMRPARFCGTKQVERRRALGALKSKAEDQLAEATQLPSRLMGPANNMYERAKALEVLGPRVGSWESWGGGSTNHTRLSGLVLAH